MSEPPYDTPPAPRPEQTTQPRMRSVPYRTPFISAGLFALINYWAAFSILVVLPLFLIDPTLMAQRALIGCVAFYFLSAIASFLKRRKVLCPLCKGTPLLSTRAHVHPKAFRIFPLDHGTTATLALIFTQTFRCMFCGSRFDLLKPKPPRHECGHAHQDSLS